MSDAPAKPKWRACCLVVAVIFLALVVIYGCVMVNLASVALPNFSASQTRANIARVMSDMRTYEDSLESFYNVNKAYPPFDTTAPPLTTPIAYLNAMRPDRFSKAPVSSPESWIRYAVSGNEFVIWSIGPDRVSQIKGKPELKAGYNALVIKEYDATNGIKSAGDIFRTSLAPERTNGVSVRVSQP